MGTGEDAGGREQGHHEHGDHRCPARQVTQGKAGEDHQEQGMIAGEAVTGRVLGRNGTELGQAQRPVHHQGRAGTADRQQVAELIDHQGPQQHDDPHGHQATARLTLGPEEAGGQDQSHAAQGDQIEQAIVGDGHQIGPAGGFTQPAIDQLEGGEIPVIPGAMTRQGGPTEGNQAPDQIERYELAHAESSFKKR
ncbi:hypothetical protein D3C80_1203920 [compost metagenome]